MEKPTVRTNLLCNGKDIYSNNNNNNNNKEKMMNNLIKIALASVLALSSVAANAELISTDVSVTNDHLAALDFNTGLEWLNLNETRNKSIVEIQGLLGTTYDGWRLPTRQEVRTFLVNSMPDVTFNQGYTHKNIQVSDGNDFYSKMGGSSDYNHLLGIYINDEYPTVLTNIVVQGGLYFGLSAVTEANGVSSDLNYKSSTYGVYLVSDGGATLSSINNPALNVNNPNAPINNASVPLPGTLGLLSLAIAGMSFRRKSA